MGFAGMAGHVPMKLKRKDLEEVNDDFSDFSLSSPAWKIRRLDADLPPIIEEEEPEIAQGFDQHLQKRSGVVIEELPSEPENQERAIVLFNPTNTPLRQSPSSFNFYVDSDVISGFKSQFPWSNQPVEAKSADDERRMRERVETQAGGVANQCQAVVPWIPSQLHPTLGAEEPLAEAGVAEMMEAEDMGEATMEIEDTTVPAEQGHQNEYVGSRGGDVFCHWQQQHCMIPQVPHYTSTPITWS